MAVVLGFPSALWTANLKAGPLGCAPDLGSGHWGMESRECFTLSQTCLNTLERIRTQDIYVRCVCALTATEHSCCFVLGWGKAVRAMVACYTVLEVNKN